MFFVLPLLAINEKICASSTEYKKKPQIYKITNFNFVIIEYTNKCLILEVTNNKFILSPYRSALNLTEEYFRGMKKIKVGIIFYFYFQ